MKYRSWIKMGFNLLKVIVIVIMVVMLLQANLDELQEVKKEKFDLYQIIDITASATKKEEPKPVVEDKVEQNKTGVLGAMKITGDLTGYVAHCPACYGTLACKPKYKVYKNGVVTYPDIEYGNVRIVASSKKLKCGSIIRFNLKTISKEPVYAIVLDRGVLGNDIDLLVATEKEAYTKVGRRNTTYEVLRNGW